MKLSLLAHISYFITFIIRAARAWLALRPSRTVPSRQVTISQPLTLLGPVTFRGDVTVTGDVTVGQLNGESADQWLASLVLQGTEDVTLSGPLHIQQAAVAGNVLATGQWPGGRGVMEGNM